MTRPEPAQLPAHLVGTSWDTPEGRVKYARVVVDRSADPAVASYLYAVARTLRWCAAVWSERSRSDDEGWTDYWREIADQLDLLDLDGDGRPDDGGCCVVCQEVACDSDCPLEQVRAARGDR